LVHDLHAKLSPLRRFAPAPPKGEPGDSAIMPAENGAGSPGDAKAYPARATAVRFRAPATCGEGKSTKRERRFSRGRGCANRPAPGSSPGRRTSGDELPRPPSVGSRERPARATVWLAGARLCGRQIRAVKLRRRVCNSRRPHQSGTQLGQGRRLGGKSTQRTRGVNVKIAVDSS